MNRWKISFFVLAGLLAAGIAVILLLIAAPGESDPIPLAEQPDPSAYVLNVQSSKEDVEGIANTFIRKAMKDDPLAVTLQIKEDVILWSEITIFSFDLPVRMHFDPVVQEDGNLILKQSKMEIGQLNIPPATILKVLRDSVDLPAFMVVRPKEEELFIDLTKIPVSGNLQVKAKTFNLAKDEIVLEILIPNE